MTINSAHESEFDLLVELFESEMKELEMDIVLYDEMKANLDVIRAEENEALQLIKEGTPQSLNALKAKIEALASE